MKIVLNTLPLFVLSALLFACKGDRTTEIRGSIDDGVTQITISKPPLHYKYAQPETITIYIKNDGTFAQVLNPDEPEVYFIELFNERYPIYVEPGRITDVTININRFPLGVSVHGHSRDLNANYQEYLGQIMALEQHSRTERRNFLNNRPNDYLNMMRLRVQLAKEYLADSPFGIYMYKNAGEYIVARLEEIRTYKNNPDFDVTSAREAVLQEAIELDFFTLSSLKSQRAGIRDFADAWSKTFGIQTRLEETFNRTFLEYDWKRLGFNELAEIKWALLEHIDEKDARIHAEMYLIAEMIGEGSFNDAREKLYSFEDTRLDENEYIHFLRDLYTDVGAIQPGNPAPDFSMLDADGESVKLDDFKGSFVLLDFWATWCVPCLEEFPAMTQLYETYSRDNLEIISISIDEEKYAWESMLDRYPHPWIQVYAGEGFSQPLFQTYRAGGIPFYVLIDRNGEIVRLNDIRPSFNFSDVFEDLLFQELEFTVTGF